MFIIFHPQVVYSENILTKPEGRAQGRSEYICAIHQAGVE